MVKGGSRLTACCGLYCGDCIRYRSRFAYLAGALKEELERRAFAPYAEVKAGSVGELKHYEVFNGVLQAIAALSCDKPCRSGGDGCGQSCEIKKCAGVKGLEGCWQCREFEDCSKFAFLDPFHGNAPRENLRKINKYGLRRWARYRSRCYPWQ